MNGSAPPNNGLKLTAQGGGQVGYGAPQLIPGVRQTHSVLREEPYASDHDNRSGRAARRSFERHASLRRVRDQGYSRERCYSDRECLARRT